MQRVQRERERGREGKREGKREREIEREREREREREGRERDKQRFSLSKVLYDNYILFVQRSLVNWIDETLLNIQCCSQIQTTQYKNEFYVLHISERESGKYRYSK